MQRTLLTVIVPIYNSEKYLPQCIESILNQTYRKLEIILINDGSTDESGAICDKYAQMDNRIVVVHKKNEGLLKARKEGVLMAQGEVIGFVDSDDWIEPEMYAKLVRNFEDTESDMVSSGIIKDYMESGRSLNAYDNYEEGLYDNLVKTIYPFMLWNVQLYVPGIIYNLVTNIYKRNILLEVLTDINMSIFLGEDCLVCMYYLLKVNKIYIMHQAYYHYQIRKDSMCDRATPQLLTNSYLFYSELKRIFMKQEEPNVLMRQLKYYMLEMIEKNNLKKLFDIDLYEQGSWVFDYAPSVFDKKYIIYGAGVCGKALYRMLKKLGKEKNMVAWVDINYVDIINISGNEIVAPENIKQINFDYIIVAIVKKESADHIKMDLIKKYDVDANKIIWKKVIKKSIYSDIVFD